MKAFYVEFTVRAVVMAEDQGAAYGAALDEWRDISREDDPEVDVYREILCAADLPSGWDLECVPYGGDGNTRLEALIDETAKGAA